MNRRQNIGYCHRAWSSALSSCQNRGDIGDSEVRRYAGCFPGASPSDAGTSPVAFFFQQQRVQTLYQPVRALNASNGGIYSHPVSSCPEHPAPDAPVVVIILISTHKVQGIAHDAQRPYFLSPSLPQISRTFAIPDDTGSIIFSLLTLTEITAVTMRKRQRQQDNRAVVPAAR